MNNQTKTLLGVAVVAGLGYYLYTQSKKSSAGFVNFASRVGCPCKEVASSFKDEKGNVWDQCRGGQACQRGVKHQPYK